MSVRAKIHRTIKDLKAQMAKIDRMSSKDLKLFSKEAC